MNVQVLIFEIERNVKTVALYRRQERGVHVEIDRVAKLVTLARGRGFNAGRKINGVVTTRRALAETAEQIAQRFVTEEVETFLGDFEAHVARQRFGKIALSVTTLLPLLLARLFGLQR